MARKSTKFIVIHCSQTRPSQNIGAKDIDRWHREFGWTKIGYHKVVKRDGTIEDGRGLDEIGSHVREYNGNSIGVCIVGGAKEENYKEPEDNFTGETWESLKKLLSELVLKYPEAKIVGHYDLDKHKTCPNFDVQKYLLTEDIPNYKFQEEGILLESDLNELREAGEI